MASYTEEQKDSPLIPILATLGFHGLILLFLYLFIIHVPNPPFPVDSGGSPGVEVRLGDVSEGMGDNPTDASASAKVKAVSPPSTPDDNSVIVNNTEESIALEQHKVKKTEKKHPEKMVAEIKPAAPQPSSDLMKALDNWDKTSKTVSGGHGTGNKTGNEGDPNGNPNGKGIGPPGDGGPGTGPGGPGGPGPGGPGSGTGAHLKNRHLIVPAMLVSNEQEEGVVVVAITVDQNGKVVEAEPRAKGSTTTSTILWAKARQAAFQARFDKSPDGTAEQHGVYIFNFSFK
jgi:hypothetical protein